MSLLLVFAILLFVFRFRITDFVLKNYQIFFHPEENIELTISEKEELVSLRVENKILRDENKKIRDEFSVATSGEEMSPVYMLLGENSFYGNFFITLPKNKTPYIGMNVFAYGNVVVGQVEEILPNSLKVSKLGQTKKFIANSLENEESIELQSLGAGLYYGTVSGGSKISVDDTIVIKGYPKAIVGSVVEVQKGDSSLSNIFVRTPYNIQQKEIFYVIQ